MKVLLLLVVALIRCDALLVPTVMIRSPGHGWARSRCAGIRMDGEVDRDLTEISMEENELADAADSDLQVNEDALGSDDALAMYLMGKWRSEYSAALAAQQQAAAQLGLARAEQAEVALELERALIEADAIAAEAKAAARAKADAAMEEAQALIDEALVEEQAASDSMVQALKASAEHEVEAKAAASARNAEKEELKTTLEQTRRETATALAQAEEEKQSMAAAVIKANDRAEKAKAAAMAALGNL